MPSKFEGDVSLSGTFWWALMGNEKCGCSEKKKKKVKENGDRAAL